MGRGTLEDFEAHTQEIPGRFVLVRHEYMFASGHIHRRRKYQWAKERGAAGFLIGSHLPGHLLVTGSSGFEEPDSRLRFLLTQADTLEKVEPTELKVAALLAAEIALSACMTEGPIARRQNVEERG